MTPPHLFVGLDVQGVRSCPYAVLDLEGRPITSGWLGTATPEETAVELREVLTSLAHDAQTAVAVGIDAPRQALRSPRQLYWDGRRQTWRLIRAADKGTGRHCEVVLAAYRLANPQWTPLEAAAPSWMLYGFALFRALADFAHVYEVFPSAAYAQLTAHPEAALTISLHGFFFGPKDMLDAYVAAFTVRELGAGRGEVVGGGDGLGAIALPRPLADGPAPVLSWPV